MTLIPPYQVSGIRPSNHARNPRLALIFSNRQRKGATHPQTDRSIVQSSFASLFFPGWQTSGYWSNLRESAGVCELGAGLRASGSAQSPRQVIHMSSPQAPEDGQGGGDPPGDLRSVLVTSVLNLEPLDEDLFR